MRGPEARPEPTLTPREAFLTGLRGYLAAVNAPPEAEGKVLAWLAQGARQDPGLSLALSKALLTLAEG